MDLSIPLFAEVLRGPSLTGRLRGWRARRRGTPRYSGVVRERPMDLLSIMDQLTIDKWARNMHPPPLQVTIFNVE